MKASIYRSFSKIKKLIKIGNKNSYPVDEIWIKLLSRKVGDVFTEMPADQVLFIFSRLNTKNKIFHGSSDRDGKTRQLPVDVVRSESEVTIGATGPRYRPIAYLPPVQKMRYKPWKMLQDIHSITNHWLDKTS